MEIDNVQVVKPFGPLILIAQLPEGVIKPLNEIVDVIKDSQSKKYHLSIALIFIKLVLVFIIATGIITKRTLDDGWKEVILVIVGGYISSFAKLVEFWYNSPADDQELVRSSQDYRTGVNGNGKYYK